MRLLSLLRNSLAAGVLLFSIGTVFHLTVPLLVPALTTAYTDHPEVFRTWPGWTRTYMICYPFLYGFVFASGFHVIHAIKNEAISLGTRNGAIYGLLVFAGRKKGSGLIDFATVAELYRRFSSFALSRKIPNPARIPSAFFSRLQWVLGRTTPVVPPRAPRLRVTPRLPCAHTSPSTTEP
jgi:hypothetical protein